MIIARHYLDDLENKISPLPHHWPSAQSTANRYGSKIPTMRMVRLPGSRRWRRVYCCIWSNSGTRYVTQGKDWIVIL